MSCMSGGSLWTYLVGHWLSSARGNSHVAVCGLPHAGSVIVVVKSHVPCCRPVRIIAVGETSVLVSHISWILVIVIASIFCPHPMSVPCFGKVKNLHVTFFSSRPVMTGLYILPLWGMK